MWVTRILLPVALPLLAAGWVLGNSGNPPDGYTGAPGEATCATAGCHDSYTPYPDGAVRVDAPNRYGFGDTLDLHVVLVSLPWQMRRGFSLTVLDNDSLPAGQLIVSDAIHTQLSVAQGGRQYLKNTLAGTTSPDSLETSWAFRWATPVDPVGPVTFWVAALGADGDSTPAGDFTSIHGEFVLDNTDCFLLTGDVDLSGTLGAADIIALVNYVFKGGPEPEPCKMTGDVNCTASVTSSDVLALVQIVFKGAPAWCNVCNLWADGRWRCPVLEGH